MPRSCRILRFWCCSVSHRFCLDRLGLMPDRDRCSWLLFRFQLLRCGCSLHWCLVRTKVSIKISNYQLTIWNSLLLELSKVHGRSHKHTNTCLNSPTFLFTLVASQHDSHSTPVPAAAVLFLCSFLPCCISLKYLNLTRFLLHIILHSISMNQKWHIPH